MTRASPRTSARRGSPYPDNRIATNISGVAYARFRAEAEKANHGQVAEGVKSCLSICELGERAGVELPIADAVRRVCHEGMTAHQMAKELISRAPKPE